MTRLQLGAKHFSTLRPKKKVTQRCVGGPCFNLYACVYIPFELPKNFKYHA